MLCDHESPGRRQARGTGRGRDDRCRRAEFVKFAKAERGGRAIGCPRAVLVQRAADLDWSYFDGVSKIGVTAGASAPEILVEEILGALSERFAIELDTVTATEEGVFFPLPRPLREHEPAE